ncbi:hypothetical protein GW17_00042407 [Ensete ventricosum]|nr:hypothetical protein GW17_00042407 [Ensete ventricosum]
MRLLSLAREAAACVAFSARGCHLMQLWSVVCGRPTSDRYLMRLSHTRDRPSARSTVDSVADAIDLCTHASQCNAVVDRSDQNVDLDSQVDELPPPPHSAAVVSDAGEPAPASQIDPEAQLPPPPTDDDPPASRLEEAVSVVLQLSLSAGMVASGGPTARNHGHELAFKIYSLAVFTIYGCDITLGICLIARLVGIDRPWVRQATTPLISGVLALSFAAAAVLGTVINLLS